MPQGQHQRSGGRSGDSWARRERERAAAAGMSWGSSNKHEASLDMGEKTESQMSKKSRRIIQAEDVFKDDMDQD